MLLALDLRNRSLAIGFRSLAGGAPWLAIRRLGVSTGRSADEYALLLRSFAEGAQVEAAWMSSVVPSMSKCLCEAVESAFGIECKLVGPGVRTGVKIRTDVPSEVGSDIVCCAAAAYALFGTACVVADFGAALTFSGVGSSGDLMGVAIAPGLDTAAESLRQATAQIPDVRIEGPVSSLGRNTSASVRAGVFLGYAGLVERIVRMQREELASVGVAASPDAVAVVGTGDASGRFLLDYLGWKSFVPQLGLEGLALIASRAAPISR